VAQIAARQFQVWTSFFLVIKTVDPYPDSLEMLDRSVADPTLFHPGSELFSSRNRITEFKYFKLNPKHGF
jgi:hypothetical protein